MAHHGADAVHPRIEDSVTEKAPRVLLVDDHALFRMGMRKLLQAEGIDIVGEASNGRDGVRLAREVTPDVVIMDLEMPVMDGVEATRRLIAANEDAAIVVLTATDGDEPLDALLAGASGFLLKNAGASEIAGAVRAAAHGESSICPSVAGRLVERLRVLEADRRRLQSAQDAQIALTARETEVLRLLAAGRDNGTIAGSLFISPSTVKHHVAAILDKLGVDNRVQAAVEAVRIGVA